MAKIEWKGSDLRMGPFVLAEVHEAGMMSGHIARYRLSGGDWVTVASQLRFKATNENARKLCEGAVRVALDLLGIEVDP